MMDVLVGFLQDLLLEGLGNYLCFFVAMRVMFLFIASSIDHLPQNAHKAAHNSLQEWENCLQEGNQPCRKMLPFSKIIDLK